MSRHSPARGLMLLLLLPFVPLRASGSMAGSMRSVVKIGYPSSHFLRVTAVEAALDSRSAGDTRTGLGRSASGNERAPLELKLPRYPSRRMHDLAKDRGNVVLLDVWATWCEPCRVALPVYERLLKQYGKRGFKVYAINVDEDQDEIRPFIKLTKLSLPVLLDRDAEIAETKLGVRMMPTSFVLDRQGRIRHVHEGFAPDFVPKFKAQIEALLAEKAPVGAHADP